MAAAHTPDSFRPLMKRLSALCIAAIALCLNACEQHKAAALPAEYHKAGEKKAEPAHASPEHK